MAMIRKLNRKPKLHQCRPTEINWQTGPFRGSMEYCETHRQSHAACLQMAQGGLCYRCNEWHTGVCQNWKPVVPRTAELKET